MLDAKRALIKEGKEQCMLMGRMLGALKVQVDVIVSSPLKRALQTAQFVGTELGYEAKVEISAALGLDADFAAFQKLLDKYADREGVLIVGHNPNLFKFLGRIITGNGGALHQFRDAAIQAWRKWLSRRKRGRLLSWTKLTGLMERFPLPAAVVVHSVYRAAAKP